MALNPFFRQEVASEQRLVQDLVNEHLRMYGQEVYYMPRKYLGTDTIMRENTLAIFNDAYSIEAYVANVDGFQGSGDLMSKFGIRVTDEATFIVSKERFEDYIADIMSNVNAGSPQRKGVDTNFFPDRPMEGDLVYFPLTDSLFEVKFVEHENPFYQLGQLYTYELRCELFEYEQEVIDTDFEDIDNNAANYGYVVTLNLAGSGVQATASAGIKTGSVHRIVLENDGYGYSTVPTVSISTSPNGSSIANATAVAIGTIGAGSTTYSIQSIEIVNSGFGYTQTPSITIVGDGFGAKARADISATGVLFIDGFTSGNGYSVDANVGITTSPVGLSSANAVARAIVTNGSVSGFRFTNAGFGYTQTPTLVIDTPYRKRLAIGIAGVTTSVGTYTTTGITTAIIGIGTTVVGVATTAANFDDATPTVLSGIDTTGIEVGDQLQVGYGVSDGTFVTLIGVEGTPDVVTLGLDLTFVGTGTSVFTFTRIIPTGVVTSISTSYTTEYLLGELSSVSVTDPGIGYTQAPTVTIADPSAFRAGIITAGIGIGSTVNSLTVFNSGVGYGVTPVLRISDPSGFRVGIITVGLSNSGIGTTIGSISVASSGAFYGSAPILTITGPSTTPDNLSISTATAVAFINSTGIITGAQITNPGYGYTTTDTLTVTLTGGISTATATVAISTVGIMTTTTITNPGFGYTTIPTVSIIGGIATATAVSVINSSGAVTGANVTYAGFGYTTIPSVTLSEPRNPINSGDYILNEMVVGQTGLTTALVKGWNKVTRTLEVYSVAGNFGIGEVIAGSAGTVGAANTDHVTGAYILESVQYDQLDAVGTDAYADNKEFQDAADDIVDWNETNPFGTF